MARLSQAETIDLLHEPRRVREVGLPTQRGGRPRIGGVVIPWLAVGLTRQVGQRIKPILRPQRDLIDGNVGGTLPLRVKDAFRVEVSIRWSVGVRHVAL